ncbi:MULTISPECIES: response regulator transcription factor [unclassified Streptomyces]|uniref:response regulator transcription factor n=1 Tax=unclassified Streptomyces TaxID=2593676 RepID=UPI0033CE7513
MRAALEQDPGLIVVGEAGDLCELVSVAALCAPDVVVLVDSPARSHGDTRDLVRLDACVVVVVTDADTAADWIRSAHADVTALVHSDDPEEELVTAVRRARDGSGYVSPGLSGSLLRCVRATPPRRLSLVPTHTPLTSRESEVLALIRRGLANKEIARQLGLSEKTVKFHVSNVLAKAHMASRAQLIASAAG